MNLHRPPLNSTLSRLFTAFQGKKMLHFSSPLTLIIEHSFHNFGRGQKTTIRLALEAMALESGPNTTLEVQGILVLMTSQRAEPLHPLFLQSGAK